MNFEEYEKTRKEILAIETIFTKVKEKIFYYPKALHPLAVASKELSQCFEQFFQSETSFAKVASIFNTTFTGIVAIYNETVYFILQ